MPRCPEDGDEVVEAGAGWRARLWLRYLPLLIFPGRSSGSGMLSQHLHFRHGVMESWSHGHTRAASAGEVVFRPLCLYYEYLSG